MIILTKDGSETIRKEGSGITYHSIHGALQESKHVYIEAGLEYWLKENPAAKSVRIFEMGFGTGLNAMLTALKAESLKVKIFYSSIDNEPLPTEKVISLNYSELLNAGEIFEKILSAPWIDQMEYSKFSNKKVEIEPTDDSVQNIDSDIPANGDSYNLTKGEIEINEFFILEKRIANILDFIDNNQYDIIYFDAFAPTAQPELWTEEVFTKMYSILAPGGCLVTYCSKSIIRRAMMAAGFNVTKPQGPWGKREMVRAFSKLI
ncbi:MAG: tRNA (5-methylaminomethyl-2-thiouridine)(34)-methyltransferase MnmD [Flavitalea sp.]